MEPAKFLLPQMCCKCLEPAEKTYTLGGVYGGYDRSTTMHQTTTYTLEAPICDRCSRGITRMKLWGVALLVLIPVVGQILSRVFIGRLTPWFGIGGIVLGIVVCATLWELSKPGKVAKKGIPLFNNPQYQSKFEEANNIDPASYGLMDQFTRDLNKISEQVEEEKQRSKQG